MTQDEVARRFTHYELVKMRLAEDYAPWGESAENQRMLYLANVFIGMNAGQEDSQKAWERANGILSKLFDPQPEKEPPKASDFLR